MDKFMVEYEKALRGLIAGNPARYRWVKEPRDTADFIFMFRDQLGKGNFDMVLEESR